MLSCLLKCRKNISKNPRISKKNKGKLMFLSKCAVCDSKKLRFSKNQVIGLLNNLGLKIALEKILIL